MPYGIPHMAPQFFTPRTSGGGGFVPTDIAGCQLWIPADQIGGLSDGDPVTDWPDLAMGNDPTASGALSPTYKTNIINSFPIVRFGGSNAMVFSEINLAADFTIFVVQKTSGSSTIIGHQTDNRQFQASATGILVFAGGVADYSNSYDQSVFSILAASGSGGVVDYFFNGTNINGASHNVGTDLRYSALGEFFGIPVQTTGDVAEIVIYNSKLGSTDFNQVEAYEEAKYAL